MKYLYLLLCTLLGFDVMAQTGQPSEFTQIRQELQKKWPDNRTVNLVFHGHSVPSGYANTPNVKTLQAYPHQVLEAVKEIYPYAVVNSITTSIGGENAEQGAKRFKQEVLPHRPDILFIDYALNDRSIGLERALKAWEKMIKEAQKQNIPIILLTPTPDLTEDILDDKSPLEQHSRQLNIGRPVLAKLIHNILHRKAGIDDILDQDQSPPFHIGLYRHNLTNYTGRTGPLVG